MSHDFAGDLIVVVDEVMKYAKASALYEMQCKINEAKALMRRETLGADASVMHVLTKNLAMAKLKLSLLKEQVKSLPPAYQDAVSCLLVETEQYIESLRRGRNCIVGRRRS